MTDADKEIEKISQKIVSELETAKSKNLPTARYAKRMLQLSDIDYTKGVLTEIQNASPRRKSDIEKKAVIKALLYSTWLQRLYFIIRSALMGLLGAALTAAIIVILGTVNVFVYGAIAVGVFVGSLAITRLFDAQVVWATRKIVQHLANYKAIRDFIMNHL